MMLDELETEYATILAQNIDQHPERYRYLDASQSAEHVFMTIRAKGINHVSLKSATWKALSKKYGIPHTYGAWKRFLASKMH